MGARTGPPGVKLALDHHYSPAIARLLRDSGHDVIAISERGWEAEDDDPLLELCAGEQRALLTNNVSDFAVIDQQWRVQGRSHQGLIFTSDTKWPRNRNTIGRYVDALSALLEAHPKPNDFADRVHWL